MSRVIRRTRQVQEDIIAIYRYIHQRSPRSADKVLDAIEQSIQSLANTPGIGSYWNSPARRLEGMKVATVRPYRNYLIFFRANSPLIEVFRIVHAARELQTVIDEIEVDFESGED